MLPSSAVITDYLAKEYDILLKDAILVRTLFSREQKRFFFFLLADTKYHLRFSFSPPDFLLRERWPTTGESFEIWKECAGSRVAQVSGSKQNRLIRFDLVHDRSDLADEKFTILFELFGALANAYLLADDGMIRQALRVVRDKRALRPRSRYCEAEPLAAREIQDKVNIYRNKSLSYDLVIDGESYQIKVNPQTTFQPDKKAPLVSLYQHLEENFTAAEQLKKRRGELTAVLRREIKRDEALQTRLERDLDKCKHASRFQKWADTLMANPHQKAQTETLFLSDLETGTELEIPLLLGRSVIQTAEAYYKKAKKLKRTPAVLSQRVTYIGRELQRLESQLEILSAIDDPDELVKTAAEFGIEKLRKQQQRGRGGDDEESKYYRIFESSAGEKILVGKSSLGNAELTFKVARTYDIWLHTQQSQGSHVILVLPDKNHKPSQQSILEAAQLAAYFSAERKGSNVPVIYTERRNVRKQRKGAPGQVIYQNVKSIFVDPKLPD